MRLQLIRYESVELTEQLMREKQRGHAEEGDDDEAPGAAPPETQVELRGLLLEEQKAEAPVVSCEEGAQEESLLFCILTGGADNTVILQYQDAPQEQDAQTV